MNEKLLTILGIDLTTQKHISRVEVIITPDEPPQVNVTQHIPNHALESTVRFVLTEIPEETAKMVFVFHGSIDQCRYFKDRIENFGIHNILVNQNSFDPLLSDTAFSMTIDNLTSDQYDYVVDLAGFVRDKF